MWTQLGLEQRHLRTVTNLLQEYVPDYPVWAFGSRTFGRARRYSDLDLAVGGAAPLAVGMRLDLMDAFDQSMLPIEIDVIDLNDVDESFCSRIEPDFLIRRRSPLHSSGTRVPCVRLRAP